MVSSLEDFEKEWELMLSGKNRDDLQLAAELGKSLLERNKELENCIKLHLCTIEDQAQEIEYMKKQSAALREANDSRLKIYEQLEVSIQDLERANQRLTHENANDKKQIKSQCLTIDALESRTEDLQKEYDALNARYKALLREQQAKSQLDDTLSSCGRTAPTRDGSTQNMAVSPKRASPDEEVRIQQLASTMSSEEDVTQLLQQLQEVRSQRAREQKKASELKDQLDVMLLEYNQMEDQLNVWKAKARDLKNLQNEITTLEEVREGNLCGRCLRSTNPRMQDEVSAMLDQEEEVDEMSLAESLPESLHDVDSTLQELNLKNELSGEDSGNPYRVLVEKYEALLKLQNSAQQRKAPALSLQEELQMSGEFNNLNSTELESNHESGRASSSLQRAKKRFAGTPTDFSEAETSSSGFSDETSNKATQTDGRPGSFLCSIADGDEYKFSIYDDNSTFDGRFHQAPEYRRIFNEIFEVLKRAAIAKDEGMDLPLADDADGLLTPKAELGPDSISYAFAQAAAAEEAPSELTDDTRSVVSLAVSSVASEPVFRVHTPVFSRKRAEQLQQQNETTPEVRRSEESRPLHNGHRLQRQPLEYLQVQARKRSSKKSRRQATGELPSTPDIIPTPNPRVTQLKGSGRRKFRPLTSAEISDGIVWNGCTAHFYSSRRSRQQQGARDPGAAASAQQNYKPGSAAEEVAKLRRLEMSYAEVLRTPNKSKESSGRARKHH